jgi:hypothetical protein
MTVIIAIRHRLNGRENIVLPVAYDVDGIQHGRECLNPTLVLEQARLRLRRRCDQQERKERLHEPDEDAVKFHRGIASGHMRENTAGKLNVC